MVVTRIQAVAFWMYSSLEGRMYLDSPMSSLWLGTENNDRTELLLCQSVSQSVSLLLLVPTATMGRGWRNGDYEWYRTTVFGTISKLKYCMNNPMITAGILEAFTVRTRRSIQISY
jgi:hypothetical protein